MPLQELAQQIPVSQAQPLGENLKGYAQGVEQKEASITQALPDPVQLFCPLPTGAECEEGAVQRSRARADDERRAKRRAEERTQEAGLQGSQYASTAQHQRRS